GELVGYLMGYTDEYASKNMAQILKTIAKFKAAVNFHCADIWVVEKLCNKFHDINFVLAHPSEKEVFLNRLKTVAKFENLYLDCSGTGIDRYGMLRKAFEIAGKKKLLFGTDYPINNPAVYISGALFEKLPQDFYRNFFSGNFRRLLGL
ncbi:MAG: amidohydrolase family protein, partial [bacterium]|nr:amidohydrolase family protein [bacterium]